MKNVGSLKNGKKSGQLNSYWANGQLKRNDFYKKGVLLRGKCFNVNGVEVPYYDFESRPKFPGGIAVLYSYLQTSFNYDKITPPKDSSLLKSKIKFYVDIDGSIIDVRILNNIDPVTDNEILRVFKNMPKWKPGMIDGNKIKVPQYLPITFKFNNGTIILYY